VETSLRLVEQDLESEKESLAKVDGQIEYLEEEINKIKSAMMKKSKSLKSLHEEERRWATLLQKMKHNKVKQEPAVRKRKPNDETADDKLAAGRPVRPLGMKRRPPGGGNLPIKKKSTDGDNTKK
jgi:chromosome segregation ATPase